MSKLPIALFISAGDQDIKRLLPPPSGTDKDRERGRLRSRRLHAWLQEGLRDKEFVGYNLVLPDELASLQESGSVTTITHEQGLAIRSDEYAIPLPSCSARVTGFLSLLKRVLKPGDKAESHALLLDCACNILLTPAKIEKLLPGLIAAHKAEMIEVQRIVVFATDRLSPEEYRQRLVADGVSDIDREIRSYEGFYADEPFMAGEVLARWLATLFGLDYLDEYPFQGRPGTRWVNVLKGLTRFEGEPGTRDHPLRRRLARYIDDAFVDAAKDSGDTRALIAVTGGSNDVKACILASADLRFPGRNREYCETEFGGAFSVDVFNREPAYIIPTASLTARAAAARLIERGDIQAAWSAVAHLLGRDPDEDPWLVAVKRLDSFFRGGRWDRDLLAAADPALERPGIPMLLQRAFQVEAALQGGSGYRRIPEALTGTTAVAEHALFLMLCRAIPALVPKIGSIRIDDGVYLDGQGAPIGEGARDLLPKVLRDKQNPDRLVIFGARAAAARNWLSQQSSPSGEPDWAATGQVAGELEDFLHWTVNGAHLRWYRNRISHSALTADEEQAVIAIATAPIQHKGHVLGPLWRLHPEGERPGDHFLASPLITAVLGHLGIERPADLYRDMLQRVKDRLGAQVPI